MTIQQQIDMACSHAGISRAELSRRLGTSPQSFQKRFKSGKLKLDEVTNIAEATGGTLRLIFEYPDGTTF